MDLQELILSRRSVRKYQEREIGRAELKTVLEAAMAAPSAVAKDPWHFVALRDRKLLEGMAGVLPFGKMLRQAGAAIVVCGILQKAHLGETGEPGYMIQDCSAAVENILLSAQGLGIGSVWLGVYPNEDRVAGLRTLLSLPEDMTPLAAISLGYPAENPPPRTRYNEEYVTWKD